MNIYKEYLCKKILETVNIEIETGADFDVTVNFCRDEYNFYLTLSREGEELEFDFIDDRLANKWYTFVPDLTTHNLWELVEQYKTGKLRDYY